ncbi:PD-(D/E)XK nuclease superfamily protein [Arachidicoccus rhizosphaerae]|uniref:PD-(D/E)XK nuclease superfamily protein n=1 Tax=Arachidicoccus rhizosphaerae TaxID=551991 RepID=A0A1H4BFN2_9BACT|nr:AAA family ATPase [Arachidicoccus rhizosphaerae]SEA46940.1 PD-(D/E)XK nuclease superfamily protein [Arachidicoccus rhizosphaerae]
MSAAIIYDLSLNAKKYGVELTGKGIVLQLRELLEKLAERGKVVILIDEHDKPIIDFLDDRDMVETNRSILKSFYSILKGNDKYIQLLLIIGVTPFSKVSIFSDLNNLDNITLSSHYGGLVGITQSELEENFSREITELQKNKPDILPQIKDWYNGYTWNMKEWVYNPFSLLKFLKDPVFRNYWFTTGTPTFLIQQLKRRAVYDVEGIEMGSLALSTFDTDNPNSGSLLFQTGYLTIKNISSDDQIYELGCPNREVKASLLDGLLSLYREAPWEDSVAIIASIKKALNSCDIKHLVTQLNTLISTIAYDHWKADTESIFNIIVFLTFRLAGVDVFTEVHSARGRSDVLVKTADYIYVLEFKLDGTAAEALHQIKDKGYLKPYLTDPRQKIAVGITFSSKDHEVAEFLTEEQ